MYIGIKRSWLMKNPKAKNLVQLSLESLLQTKRLPLLITHNYLWLLSFTDGSTVPLNVTWWQQVLYDNFIMSTMQISPFYHWNMERATPAAILQHQGVLPPPLEPDTATHSTIKNKSRWRELCNTEDSGWSESEKKRLDDGKWKVEAGKCHL